MERLQPCQIAHVRAVIANDTQQTIRNIFMIITWKEIAFFGLSRRALI